jgi:hypothetical protein
MTLCLVFGAATEESAIFDGLPDGAFWQYAIIRDVYPGCMPSASVSA